MDLWPTAGRLIHSSFPFCRPPFHLDERAGIRALRFEKKGAMGTAVFERFVD